MSLRQALKEQGLEATYHRLADIVPDIRHQYTGYELDREYLLVGTRALHAFQVALIEEALQSLNVRPDEALTAVDIGDSAGTHLLYLKALHANVRALGVNVDPEAVRRIQARGLEALCARAEDVEGYGIRPDLCLSFETLEHLSSPIEFLRALASVSTCRRLVITVPFVTRSRVGLRFIRTGDREEASPERTHVFELCPPDWRLIFNFSGWKVMSDRVYLQYPKRQAARLMKGYWRTVDFEGFYGAILAPDPTWWP
jgi:hypothetical protein